jgi:hypothetical protein
VISADRWRENWRVVSPPGAVRVHVPRSAARRRASKQVVRALAVGSPVVLSASAPGAIGRCRHFASEVGVELDRAYLAFPSAETPAYLVEDGPAPEALFVKTVLAAPPRTSFALPIQAGLSLLRLVDSWRLLRRIAPGRVVVGRRA